MTLAAQVTALAQAVAADVKALYTSVASKQATLVSGTNIKTLNGQSLLGPGDVPISGATIADIQSGAPLWLSSVAGSNTITGSLTPALTAYAAGQAFRFVAAAANTGAVTLNINGLGAKSLTKTGSEALTTGDILAGAVVQIVYDGTRFQLQSGVSGGVATVKSLVADKVQVGTSATAANNFITEAMGDGTLQVRRQSGEIIYTLDSSGRLDGPVFGGVSSTPADVTAQRALGATYTNTGKAPKEINARLQVTSTNTIVTAMRSGVMAAQAQGNSTYQGFVNLSFAVKSGASYSIAPTTGTAALVFWGEQ